MACKLRFVLLLFTLSTATSTGADPTPQKQMESFTKHVKGVPIFNYQFASSSKDRKEPRECTTWFVVAHKQSEQEMRDFCALTLLGKKHCRYVAQSMPSFIFEGSEDELHVLLDAHGNMIEFVEPDHEVNLWDDGVLRHPGDGIGPQPPAIEQFDPYWGLDRIDQRRPGLSKSYKPGLDGGYGTGVHVYVTDTGVMTTHEDLEGRAIPTLESTGTLRVCDAGDTSCANDHMGHGSHCAGIIGGKRYGVAKNATIHAVQVLGNGGRGEFSWSFMAQDWIATNHQKPAVMSMSLGGLGTSVASKRAVDACVEAGITVVVAAGNSNANACGFQPAFVPSAITVGATDPSVANRCSPWWRKSLKNTVGDSAMKLSCGGYDPIAYYSNFGPCLDIFAPGSDITSCGIQNTTSMAVMSGTSMACPAVSGSVALILSYYDGKISPAEVKSKLKEHATKYFLMEEPLLPKPNSTTDFLYIGPEWGAPEADSRLSASQGIPMLMWNFLALIGIPAAVGSFVIYRKSAAAREIKARPLLG